MSGFSCAPITPRFGSEISGLDLGSELNEETVVELRSLLAEHGILLFREQQLSPRRQAALMRRFGVLLVSPRKEYNHRDEPAVALLGNATENGRSIAFMNEVGIDILITKVESVIKQAVPTAPLKAPALEV